jgi:hypothetical protein
MLTSYARFSRIEKLLTVRIYTTPRETIKVLIDDDNALTFHLPSYNWNTWTG